jgi:poly-gamma-glutamate capsule biosynthesis protein CapA/YwtB (metallophosphatase superfamily)
MMSWPALGKGRTGAGQFHLNVLGQSLIAHDFRGHGWASERAIQRLLGQGDATFSDLECVLLGPRAGEPTRKADTLHPAPPEVLDALRSLGVNFLATSNNHAFDLGTGGILDTMAYLRERNFAFAGSGDNLAQASAPGFLQTAAGTLAVVSAAAGFVRDGGAATATRAGVFELRGTAGVGLVEEDAERMLASIREAKKKTPLVLAYLHNHLWEPQNWITSQWQRQFARECVDAGASLFVCHGAPILQGLEMYRGAPLFHGLASFIFQTRKDDDAYGPLNWQGLVAQCRFDDGQFHSADLIPLQLDPMISDARGLPSLARGAGARAVLERMAELSATMDFRLSHDGRRGRLRA